MNQTIENRVAAKNRTGKWPDDPEAVKIPDPPDPPKTDTRICPHCNVPFVKNKNRGALMLDIIDGSRAEDEFAVVCPLCGSTPY